MLRTSISRDSEAALLRAHVGRKKASTSASNAIADLGRGLVTRRADHALPEGQTGFPGEERAESSSISEVPFALGKFNMVVPDTTVSSPALLVKGYEALTDMGRGTALASATAGLLEYTFVDHCLS